MVADKTCFQYFCEKLVKRDYKRTHDNKTIAKGCRRQLVLIYSLFYLRQTAQKVIAVY